MKKTALIILAYAVFCLSGCLDNGSDSPDEAAKITLINPEPYDGTENITLEWGGTSSSALFSKSPLLPFGVFVPEQMETYEYHDGKGWGYDDKRQEFTLFEEFQIDYADRVNEQNTELESYEEYVGTENAEGILFDYFVFEVRNAKYVARFRYFEEEKETALPMFLEVLRHLQYVTD